MFVGGEQKRGLSTWLKPKKVAILCLPELDYDDLSETTIENRNELLTSL